MRRIGSRAGFGVAAIGLVFAAYQVQGWKMPRLLAAILIVSMLVVAGVALLSIIWEAIKELRGWRELRETSLAWIASEPPGALDGTEEEHAALATTRKAVADQGATVAEAIAGVSTFRDSVRDFAEQNYSRTLKASNERLADQIDAVIAVLRRSLKDAQRLEALLERKAKP